MTAGNQGKAGKLPYGNLKFKKQINKWVWRYYGEDGGRPERSTGTDNRTEALKIARQWAIEELAQREGIIPITKKEISSSRTIEEACIAFYSQAELDRADGTLEMFVIHIEKKIFPFFGKDKPLGDIRVKEINDFRKHLVNQGLKAQYVNKILSTLSGVFKYAVEIDWIETIPQIRRLSEEDVEYGYVLNDDQIDALLKAARKVSHPGLRYVALGLFCGLRNSECVNLRWENVELWNWDEIDEDQAVVGLIHLDRQKNKTAAPRPLLWQAREILEEVPKCDRFGFVIDYWEGQPVKKMRRTWNRIRKEAGLDHIRKRDGRMLGHHDLRHTFSTRFFDQLGYSARFFSGHSSREAFRKYLHADRDKVFREAKDVFGKRGEKKSG